MIFRDLKLIEAKSAPPELGLSLIKASALSRSIIYSPETRLTAIKVSLKVLAFPGLTIEVGAYDAIILEKLILELEVESPPPLAAKTISVF